MGKKRYVCANITGSCIIAAVIFGPLAFGSVEPWAYSILVFLSFTALASSVLRAVFEGNWSRDCCLPLAFGILALGLVASQLIPLPSALAASIQPATVSVLTLAGELSGEPQPPYLNLSLYPHATRVSFLKMASYLAFFLAACSYIRTRKHIAAIATAIVASAFLASLVAILQNLAGVTEIFGLREIERGIPFGPFVSRNQFAAYALISFFCGISLILARGAKTDIFVRSRPKQGKLPPSEPALNVLLAFAVAIIGASLIWSLSRGGIVAGVRAGAVAFFCAAFNRGASRRAAFSGATILFVFALITWLGWSPVLERLGTLGIIFSEDPVSIDRYRYVMWGDAYRMWQSFPFLGAGAGTFISAYPAFRTLPTSSLVRNPHSEYLGVLAETGFIGLILMFFVFTYVFWKTISRLRSGPDQYTGAFMCGGLGAFMAVFIHSFVDFPLRSPAIVTTLVIFCAMVLRLAGSDDKHVFNGRSRHGQKTQKDGSPAWTQMRNVIIIACVLAAWAFGARASFQELHGQLESRRIAGALDSLTPKTANMPEYLEALELSVSSHSPRNAALFAELADYARAGAETINDPIERLRLAEKALELRERAAGLEPVNAKHRYQLLIDYLALGRPDKAWLNAVIAASIWPDDPWIRADIAETFFMSGMSGPALEFLTEAAEIAEKRDTRAERRIQRLKRRYVE